ncbi:MAG: glycosyltransferase family 4 protein [Patescibacteria group bacterium]
MKIALVAPIDEHIPPKKYGGIGRIVSILANGLTSKGHNVILLGPGDSETNAKVIPIFPKSISGLKAYRNDPLARAAYFQSAVAKIVAILQKQKFDIINNHLGWRLVPFHKILPSPLITTLHTPLDESNKQITYTEYQSSRFISISKNQRRPLPKLNYVATIYNGIDLDLYNLPPKHNGYFVFLGRMSPEKGVFEAIKVAKKLKAKLILAGAIPGWNYQFFDLKIRPLIDDKQIIFVGEVTDRQKNRLLGRARALLAPIKCNEAFGLTFVEAMACGTPVVALARGSAEEIIVHGKTGFIARSVDQMVKYCRVVDKIKREDCRDHAFQFSAQRMVDGYEKVFQKITEYGR